ncbi:MAG: hypothetical protein L6Q77_07340 [Bacteroidetes bacterium]|nr:hypothetical protein [Bacteroidota bacterium]
MTLLRPLFFSAVLLLSAPAGSFSQTALSYFPDEITVTGMTRLPLTAGGELTSRWSNGLGITAEAGYMPEFYLTSILFAIEKMGALSTEEAELIQSALANSLVLGVSGGWKPFKTWGFTLSGGYQYFTLGGGVAPANQISSGTGRKLPAAENPKNELGLEASVHQVQARLGYEWVIEKHWVPTVSVTGFYTFHSAARITTNGNETFRSKEMQSFADASESELTTLLDTWFHFGTLNLGIGYRF